MPANLINRAAELMREQAGAYRQLNSASAQLAAALTRGAPEAIESIRGPSTPAPPPEPRSSLPLLPRTQSRRRRVTKLRREVA